MYHPGKIQAYLTHISEKRSPVEDRLKRNIFRYGLWLLAIPAIIYGAADRCWAASSTAAVTITDISYCLIALVLLLGWVCIGLAEDHSDSMALADDELVRANTLTVESNCIAQQCYRLPFPYLCQIYHLLNVGHLESIHRFSLGNLKVVKISDFRKTEAGGQIRFKTMLDSSMNVLRLWRDPSVEVELTIHSPHQIELKVPAYGQKFIHVLFSVIPLSDQEHHLSIQMFSDLQWPRELLKALLIVAASLTLLEDLPYLHRLSKRNYDGPFSQEPRSKKKTNQARQLFYRYVDLYNNRWKARQLQLSD